MKVRKNCLAGKKEKKRERDRKATETQQALCAVGRDLKGWLIHRFSLELEQID